MNTDLSDSDRIAQLESRVKALEEILSTALEMAKSHPLLKPLIRMLDK